jgi:hypothetical protein
MDKITKKSNKWPQKNITNGQKIYQMAAKYTNFLQNVPKFQFLV